MFIIQEYYPDDLTHYRLLMKPRLAGDETFASG